MNDLDRSRPPSRGTFTDFDFPSVDRRRLPTGLDLRVAQLHRLPVVSLNLFMRASEAALRPANAGLSVATADTVEGGTKKRSGSALAEALEGIGARMSVSAGWEGTSLSLSCLADRLPEALGIVAEAILQPGFPDGEVERVRQQQLAAIRQRLMDPSSLATDSANARFFADGVPWARRIEGGTESVERFGPGEMAAWAEANYRPERGGLVLAGDVDAGEVATMVLDHFGDWTGAPTNEAAFEVTPRTRERRIHIVHRPGSVQSEIRIGHVGTKRSDPDYYALSIANMVLGGMFTSRLNLNLREKNGFTYGVRSRFLLRTAPGPFRVSTAVGNDVTAAAVREIMNELEAIAGEGPTTAEVTAARDYAAGIFGLQLETAGQVATRVSQLVVYDLPDDHFDEYRDRIRAVDAESAAAAARRHIRPHEAQIVLVGDADVIATDLEGLDLGPVEVVQGGA
ncbi:MAG: insulinase family protein [Gemmatimonadetes bacterium]|nr:insulinase family protein [Gemmatimonadota bacterium]NNL29719.1 insulinase family protein [Gemmatimonadota bacterium]